MDVEQYGAWEVRWSSQSLSIRNPGSDQAESFEFTTLILPVEIIVLMEMPDPARAMLKRANGRTEVLAGAPRRDLERFKQRVSLEVLAAVRNSPYGCSDCAKEAGILASTWNQEPCPGCREPYCRNPRCLRRLRLVVRGRQARLCKHCGTDNDPA